MIFISLYNQSFTTMKKIILILTLSLATTIVASAQVIPSFQFGLKGGVNLASISKSGTFNSSNQAGYLAGLYARFGALGFNFQPEAYLTSKNVTVGQTQAKFTSIDVPLLFGGKLELLALAPGFIPAPWCLLLLTRIKIMVLPQAIYLH